MVISKSVVLVVRCLGGPCKNMNQLSLEQDSSPHFPVRDC